MFISKIIGIIVAISSIGLSGCFEINQNMNGNTIIQDEIKVTGDTDKIEITDYTVTTAWTFSESWIDGVIFNHSGFYHDYPDNVYDAIIDVKGKIKNIADEHLNKIRINVLFCDENNKTLTRETNTINDLPVASTADFHVYVAMIETLHFADIVAVKFEIFVE